MGKKIKFTDVAGNVEEIEGITVPVADDSTFTLEDDASGTVVTTDVVVDTPVEIIAEVAPEAIVESPIEPEVVVTPEAVAVDAVIAPQDATESTPTELEPQTNTDVAVEATIAVIAPQEPSEALVEAPAEEAVFVRDTSGEDEYDKAIDLYINVAMVPELREIVKKVVKANPEKLLLVSQYVNAGVEGDAIEAAVALNI